MSCKDESLNEMEFLDYNFEPSQSVIDLGKTRGWDIMQIQEIFNDFLVIEKAENVPGAGMILLRSTQTPLRGLLVESRQRAPRTQTVSKDCQLADLRMSEQLDPSLEILIVREKSNDGRGGKFGFPKGKTQYQCSTCQVKNCLKHRTCQKCSQSEQLCSIHWRCFRCRELKESPFCPKHQNRVVALNDQVVETRGECALREVYQEIGIDYRIYPHVIVGWLKIGRNTYFLVFTEKADLVPQEDEIDEIRWVDLKTLGFLVNMHPERYNMGIRRLFSKYQLILDIWIPYCHQIYYLWLLIRYYLRDMLCCKLLGDCSLFFWALFNIPLNRKKLFVSISSFFK